jgi:hypothetical protein
MNDWTDYDWTPEERAIINRDRDIQAAVQFFLNMSWFDRRRCMLFCKWIRFKSWGRKHEREIQVAMLAVMILLTALTILRALKAN